MMKTTLSLGSLLLAASVLAGPAIAEDAKAAPTTTTAATPAPTPDPAKGKAPTASRDLRLDHDRMSWEERKAKQLARMKGNLEKLRAALKKKTERIAEFKGPEDQKTVMVKEREVMELKVGMFEKKIAALEAAKGEEQVMKVLNLPNKDTKNPHKAESEKDPLVAEPEKK